MSKWLRRLLNSRPWRPANAPTPRSGDRPAKPEQGRPAWATQPTDQYPLIGNRRLVRPYVRQLQNRRRW